MGDLVLTWFEREFKQGIMYQFCHIIQRIIIQTTTQKQLLTPKNSTFHQTLFFLISSIFSKQQQQRNLYLNNTIKPQT